MTLHNPSSDILIYQAPNWAIELKWNLDKEIIWANQAQLMKLYGVDQSVISRHIRNIFKDGEIEQQSNMQKMHIPFSDKPVAFYSLDVILSIWYRTNSQVAIQFRKWANNILKQHITQWYTINQSLIQKNYDLFMKAVEEVKALSSHTSLWSDDILELVKLFSQTWLSLDAFDKGELFVTEQSQQTLNLHAKELYDDILTLKSELMSRGEASELFAQEKNHGNLEGIFGNVFQSAYGDDAYPSIESKAAHILYFIIKNHPFTDGNKRSGAFAFIWLLQKAGYTFRHKITPEALTAITLLIATSQASEKERLINLVILLLQNRE